MYYPNYYQAPTSDERIWVQNETAAEAYLIAPNSFVRLWDANQPCFYEKRADSTGRPMPLDVYEYKLRGPKEPTKPVDYTAELNEIKDRLAALEGATYEQSNDDDTAIQSV